MLEGSGNTSLECLLWEEEWSPPPFWPLPWEPVVPDCFKLLVPSILWVEAATGLAATSNELWRQLPNRAAFQDPLEEVVLSLAELEFSSLTTFRGFSKALRMYLMRGRLEILGLRQDLATMAMAHTSSNRSSSIIKEGSTIFWTSSLSYILMQGSVWSNHSLTWASLDALIPSLPVTSSSNTFPKQ